MALAGLFPTNSYFSYYFFPRLRENWECIRPNTRRWLNRTQISSFRYILRPPLVRNRCIFAAKTIIIMGKSPSRRSMYCTQGSIQGRAKWSQVVTFSVHNFVRISVLLAHRSYTDGPPISSTYIVR